MVAYDLRMKTYDLKICLPFPKKWARKGGWYMNAITSPELALFNAVFSYARNRVCERVYDIPPDKQATCPFIVLGTEQTTGTENKSDIDKRLFLTVHVWCTTEQRQELELIRAKLVNLKKIRALVVSGVKQCRLHL